MLQLITDEQITHLLPTSLKQLSCKKENFKPWWSWYHNNSVLFELNYKWILIYSIQYLIKIKLIIIQSNLFGKMIYPSIWMIYKSSIRYSWLGTADSIRGMMQAHGWYESKRLRRIIKYPLISIGCFFRGIELWNGIKQGRILKKTWNWLYSKDNLLALWFE